MLQGRLAVLDLETTGADPREDRVTEIGLLLVDDGLLVEEWSALVNPGRHIPPGIETLTGISDRMVERAPAFVDIAHDLAQRLTGRTVVAHNARFDCAFLRNEFRRAGLPFAHSTLCTVRLSRHLEPAHPRHNLDVLIERHALPCDARHRALPDARLVNRLLAALRDGAGQDALAAAAAAVTIDPAMPGSMPAVLDDLPDTPGVYLLYEPDGTLLYAGKAANNLRTQVLAHYSERGTRGRAQRAALQAGAIEWIATAGELGAALRHLDVVQRRAPLHNRRVREHGAAWALRWQPQGEPQVVPVELDGSAGALHELYGPFRSRADALAALRGLAREHQLCASLLGVASVTPCPPHTQCRGACQGGESKAAHMLRLIQALVRLRMAPWPFPGAVALVEEDRARTRAELHVVRDWRYLGSTISPTDLSALHDSELPSFDVDVYRLVRRALDDPTRLRIIDLSEAGSREIAWAF